MFLAINPDSSHSFGLRPFYSFHYFQLPFCSISTLPDLSVHYSSDSFRITFLFISSRISLYLLHFFGQMHSLYWSEILLNIWKHEIIQRQRNVSINFILNWCLKKIWFKEENINSSCLTIRCIYIWCYEEGKRQRNEMKWAFARLFWLKKQANFGAFFHSFFTLFWIYICYFYYHYALSRRLHGIKYFSRKCEICWFKFFNKFSKCSILV